MVQNAIPTIATSSGGTNTALNVTAAVVVKPTKGILHRITVIAPGSGGALVVNDNTQLGGSNVNANAFVNIPFGSLTIGQIIPLIWPCTNGIVVSQVPTGGAVFAISYA